MERSGFTLWLTGLPSAGKSTLAELIAKRLHAEGRPVEILDGDEIRLRLSKGLGFSREDRDENIRRIAFVAKLLTRVGAVAITAAISPYRAIRQEARDEIRDFVEVYVACTLEECVRRDVKGLYRKALQGEIKAFTGISDPYEPPEVPEIIVNTHLETAEESVEKILEALVRLGYVHTDAADVASGMAPELVAATIEPRNDGDSRPGC
jgi:adenylylsulfate kinase